MADVTTDTERLAWVEKARPFMVADCHLRQCRFPECIGKSNVCNMRGESLAVFMVEHDRLIAERDAEIERLRGAVQSARREALAAVVEWHEAQRDRQTMTGHREAQHGHTMKLVEDFGFAELCEELANEHAAAATYFRSLIPQEPQGEQT